MMMNVGICIEHTESGMREKFHDAAAKGFAHCQLISWALGLWTEEEAERIREYASESGVAITAFWCGWAGPRIWNFTDGPGDAWGWCRRRIALRACRT